MRTLFTSIALALFAAAMASPGAAGAAIITPNTTADQFNTDPANCSLREAVDAANDNSNAQAPGCPPGDATPDTIQLAPGTYELTIPPVADNVASGDLENTAALIVEGLPGGPVTIDANQIDRIFQAFGALTIDGVTLTGGFVESPPPLNTTGGAIAASGGTSVTLIDTAVVGNRADGSGGGLNVPGPVSLTNVTISGNTSTESGGGGIQVSGSNTLTLDHVTITDNHAVTNGTMSGGNFAGGVSLPNPATGTIHNSIVIGNTENSSPDDEPNCEGMLTSGGGNILGSIAGCTITPAGTDEANVADAGLGPLADYGGPSLTHAVLLGSTAIDQGINPCQATDQRGVTRGVVAGPCEAGAYERLADDMDGDSVLDVNDNCPAAVNARQENNDGDAQGDVCDPDDDNDGIADAADNCALLANADQADNDGDGIGNVCDPTPNPPPVAAVPLAPAGENPECAVLRAKLKKAKTKKKRRKIRKRLRALGC